jgi:DNA/RNA endonuclease YhcR with UshA esterase domain
MSDSCAAPDQDAALPASVDIEKETVLTGTVVNDEGDVVQGAYVRLLDGSGEFTAEVVTGEGGQFRFFAAPGKWTLRALSRYGDATGEVEAARGLNETKLAVSR